MDIRHRLYPYPVLSNNTAEYIDSSFDMDLQVTKAVHLFK